jgi:hypothetical protein
MNSAGELFESFNGETDDFKVKWTRKEFEVE